MSCQHFGVCGGCKNASLSYDCQLDKKLTQTSGEFREYLHSTSIKSFASAEYGFRARAELRFYHSHTLDFAMNSLHSHKIPIYHCPILLPVLQSLMPVLLRYLRINTILNHKIYACNLLCSLQNEVLVTLIYHKCLDSVWQQNALDMQNKIRHELGIPIHIVGRSKNQIIPLSSLSICETLSLNLQPKRDLCYMKQDGIFSQSNPFINIKMLEFVSLHISKYFDTPSCDALELYCGSGNFTLAIAPFFRKILATEVVKSAITLLKINMMQNDISNIIPARLNAFESIQAILKTRTFFRLKNIDIESFNFECVLVDPPRSGIRDETMLCFLQNFSTIVYISCNPLTLLQDMLILSQTHNIAHFGLFDQFPHTFHRECILILRKKYLSHS